MSAYIDLSNKKGLRFLLNNGNGLSQLSGYGLVFEDMKWFYSR
jgi:hypothetical protein